MPLPLPAQAAHLGIEILNAARRWAAARNKCRLLLDSKKASEDTVDKARKRYVRTSDELEVLVRKLEAAFQGSAPPMKRRPNPDKKPFPWREFASAVGETAKAFESAMRASDADPIIVAGQVVDVIDATPTPPTDGD